MAGRDRIELEQGGRVLRGTGSLRVSLATRNAGAPAVPYIDGVVTFDGRVAFHELEAMTAAEVRVALVGGARHTFREAVVMRQEAGREPNTYALSIDCYVVAS